MKDFCFIIIFSSSFYYILFDSASEMEQFLNRLQQISNWKQLMRASCKQNHLSTLMAVDLTILKLRKFNQKFKKSNISLDYKIKNFWTENQLRAFNWILIAVSGVQNMRIQDFGQDEWRIMQDIFYAKDLLFLQFEARRLTQKKKIKKKDWDSEQEQRLYKYVNEFKHQSKIVWNEIAVKMFADSNGVVFREGKHCREHWLNYLDPTKTRGKWTIEQDIYLIESVNQGGKKWCQCAIQLKRTQHSVKNRYNSLLVKQRKVTPSIKKQHKLISQLLSRLKDVKLHHTQQSSSEQQQELQEQLIENDQSQMLDERQKEQYDDVNCKQNSNLMNYNKQNVVNPEVLVSQRGGNHAIEIPNISVRQKDKEERLVHQHEQKVEQYNNVNSSMTTGVNLCASFDFGNYIREDNQKKNYHEYPMLSPFIYSPSPTNCLNSPVFMIKQPNVYNAFQCMFSMWGNHINIPMEQPMHQKQEQKHNQ